MFNLNENIAGWRQTLEQSGIYTSSDLKELETHLHEEIDQLLISKKLTEEEAFWIAKKRLGTIRSLNEEFSKVSFTAMWRTRLFWILTGWVGFIFVQFGCSIIQILVFQSVPSPFVAYMVMDFFKILVTIFVLFSVWALSSDRFTSFFEKIFQRRLKALRLSFMLWIASACFYYAFIFYYSFSSSLTNGKDLYYHLYMFVSSGFSIIILPLLIIVLMKKLKSQDHLEFLEKIKNN